MGIMSSQKVVISFVHYENRSNANICRNKFSLKRVCLREKKKKLTRDETEMLFFPYLKKARELKCNMAKPC